MKPIRSPFLLAQDAVAVRMLQEAGVREEVIEAAFRRVALHSAIEAHHQSGVAFWHGPQRVVRLIQKDLVQAALNKRVMFESYAQEALNTLIIEMDKNGK